MLAVRRGYIAAVFISGPYFWSYLPQLQMRVRRATSGAGRAARSSRTTFCKLPLRHRLFRVSDGCDLLHSLSSLRYRVIDFDLEHGVARQ